MAAPIISPLFPFLFLLFLRFSSASATDSVSRDFFTMEGDVAWVVQVSDLHISAFNHDRAQDLVRLLAPALRAIQPSLLLITGDITDAKNEKRTTTRQDESEWVQYRNTMDAILREGVIARRRIFDIRGNHDKYGVPYVGSNLDFFSIHSVSSQLKRLETIHSIALMGNDRDYIFLGIDDTMQVGFRGPSNLFGHPTDGRIDAVESELQYWDNSSSKLVTKVVFGHFPMSFTASSERGDRYERIFARQSVSAYICGHLHAKLSKQLWKIHTVELASNPKEPKRVKQFWEWELGDWKESRLMRILAVDRGEVSFLDINLLSNDGAQGEFQTTVFVTYPIDSRSMNRIESSRKPLRNDINALVFSVQPILNVTAKVFDSSRGFRIVEEVPLRLASDPRINKPLFHAKWNAEAYSSSSASRYWLQVFVLDSLGKETASAARPFSVDGKMAHFESSLLARLVFDVRWEELFLVLLWSNIASIGLLLSFPKLLNYFMERSPSYQRWAMSESVSSSIKPKRTLFSVIWFLIEGSKSRKLWSFLVLYFLYLLTSPWFWAHATSENGDLAGMYMFGWRVQAPDSLIVAEGLGTPDVMAITLPFLYAVVAPLILLIYSLFAERSAACLHMTMCSSKLDLEQTAYFVAEATPGLPKGTTVSPQCKNYRGWTRRIILFLCLIVISVHLKLCAIIMGFYGFEAIALSPALLWAPMVLFAAAVYSTTI